MTINPMVSNLSCQVDSLNTMADADDAVANWAKPRYDALIKRFLSEEKLSVVEHNQLRLLKHYAQEKRQDAKRQREEANALQWLLDQLRDLVVVR